ncbi:MAG: hypothetical protein VX589_13555, partial [Myxococcota bacterium]|nr:hypothetical protein [Myxococcota bacterium]
MTLIRWGTVLAMCALCGYGCGDDARTRDAESAPADNDSVATLGGAAQGSNPILLSEDAQVAAPLTDASASPVTAPADAAEAGARDAGVADAALPPCEAVAPASAHLRPGVNADFTLTIGGRLITPAGRNLRLEGFPGSIAVHPNGQVAYVASMSADDRRLYVINTDDLSVRQNLSLGDMFYGLLVTPNGARLYAAGGSSNQILVFNIDSNGELSPDEPLDAEGFIAGLSFGQT